MAIPLTPIPPAEYQRMRDEATVIAGTQKGDKVLLLANGNMLKLFRLRRFLSSALIFPYCQRFANNAERLDRLGVPTVDVVARYLISKKPRITAVEYKPLAGIVLRELIREQKIEDNLLRRLGNFVARLHQHGVYFRSLHMGNVVLLENSIFGLIDIADLKIHRLSLSSAKRLRNFQHMGRYREDLVGMGQGGVKQLLQGYLDQYESPESGKNELLNSAKKIFTVP